MAIGGSKRKRQSQATRLVKMVKALGVQLFHDQFTTPFALIRGKSQCVAWPISNRNFKRWLRKEFFNRTGTAPSDYAVREAVGVLEGKALFQREQVHLHNRVAWSGGDLYYDLSDDKGRAVKITGDGWWIVENPPLLFRRYEHYVAQVEPARDGNIDLLIPFLNLQHNDQVPLELSYIVTCFIPGIPHPIHVSHGPQGAAKSTADRIKRRLIDPSVNDIQTLTSRVEQTVQNLAQNWFCPFDNVSGINDETSDLLCRASTGGSYSKRALYTDDETVIHKLGCCVSLNGINAVVNKADLMDRAILVEYARIPETRRREEREILTDFEMVKPKILRGIFDVLAKAMQKKPTLKVPGVPRMADFTLWAMAACEAMGHGAQTFLNLYQANISEQNEEIINSNPVGLALMSLMMGRKQWSGTPSQLLIELNTRAQQLRIDNRMADWSKGPQILSRKLKELETPLNASGFKISYSRTGSARHIIIVGP